MARQLGIYVHIPFCASKCGYCDFYSKAGCDKLMPKYHNALLAHIRESAPQLQRYFTDTVYFGGGTPSYYGARRICEIFNELKFSGLIYKTAEVTVEVNPDSVKKRDMRIMLDEGINRLSIGAQSANDDILKLIGRRHSAEETLKAFDLAVKCGFDNINMDFIAGLPGDSLESFKSSISKGIALGAKSITIHTLSLKSGAYMATRENAFDSSPKHLVADMVDFSNKALSESGYHPYYMYRQGKSLGNLENVGWCKEGFDCLYNVFMMDETHTVLAVGAGAVIKLKDPKSGKIQRIYNYKYPYEYIDRFDEILRRKHSIKAFYDEYNL